MMSFHRLLTSTYPPEDWTPNSVALGSYECREDQWKDPNDSDDIKLASYNGIHIPARFNVTKIVNVYCPYLYDSFLVRKAEYATRGYPDCVRQLVHVTAASSIPSILTTNLDRRRVQRAKFGMGVSFSDDAKYANFEACRRIGSYRAMIIADVLIGNAIDGSYCQRLPPLTYDTTTGRSKVFVKYYDDEFYPKSIVYYTY